MKNPEEYYHLIWKKKFPNIVLDSDFVNEIINVSIMNAQKDAYNQAIQDAVKNAEIYVSKELPSGISLNESYYDNEWENYIFVDKESILKLKIK